MSKDTKITVGKHSFDANWEELKKDLQGSSELEVMEAIGGDFYWLVALPQMKESEATKVRFWNHFSEAAETRLRAVKGNRIAALDSELRILNSALGCVDEQERTGKWNIKSASVIGLQVLEMVKNEDYKGFKAMADIIKLGGVKEGRGGLESQKGKYLTAFAACHIRGWKLPTKKAIRDELGVLPDADSTRDADKILREIGLGGLPPS